ncbi:MAG: bifunctional glutamate N-acetyltransferase/amino-acid acetyltransferase ArgJ [Pseudomonadota bacterium]
MSKSPLAPAETPRLPGISGFRVWVAETGMKYKGRCDLLVVHCEEETSVAGVLTQSSTSSAPVQWCRENLNNGRARALVVNAGNANAFTGSAGRTSVSEVCTRLGEAINCLPQEIMTASTGVIGEQLDTAAITRHFAGMTEHFGDDWNAAAEAIMTTDTFAKVSNRTCQIGDCTVTLNGIAKGSGMIEPNMATMLAFVFTDAEIPPGVLKTLLVEANEGAFNAVTVDSDTSTSDTCLIFASGRASHMAITDGDSEHLIDFKERLADLMQDLAIQIVRDGEGATKLVRIDVQGAGTDDDARLVGKSIANSPLVKTAIAGEDANWGRIVMAVGKSGALVDQNRLNISIGGVAITANGAPLPDYDEIPVASHLKGSEIDVAVDLGMGTGHALTWTCDLTHGYIEINADYRS